MTHYFKHKMRSKRFGAIVGWVLLAIVAAIGFALLFGYGIMWLWNWLMPDLFGVVTITYWQAVGIFVLAKILFGGFGSHKSKEKKSHKGHRQCGNSNGDFAKWKFYDKYWKEEGENAFEAYVDRRQKGGDGLESVEP